MEEPPNQGARAPGDGDFGVTQIYKPAVRPRARIFAFHELGEPSYRTWCIDGIPPSGTIRTPQNAPRRSTFWVRDFLPQEFPDCAIHTIRHRDQWFVPYHENEEFRDDHQTLEDFLRSTPFEERAPIVFITYSSGGVYLKHIIFLLWGPEGILRSCTPQLDQLLGVIFLATPQHLPKELDYDDSCKPDPSLWSIESENVDEWKVKLDSISDDFKELITSTRLRIVSVSETSSSDQTMQAHETKLGDLPFSKETVVEGTATFFSLPKFQDRKERAYVDMCKWLKGFLLVPSDGPIEQNGQNWTTDVFTIQRVRPHANHHLPFKYWGSPKISFPEDSHQDDTAFWLHFPVNNETWMNEAIHTCLPSSRLPKSVGRIMRTKCNSPHSRHIPPRHDFDQCATTGVRTTELRIFLPYLHWDTVASAQAYNNAIRYAHSPGKGPPPTTAVKGLESLLNHDFPSFHPRRTLDQFYYSRMSNTSDRDADQVVSRQTAKDKTLVGGPKMMMVDQLWLCLSLEERAVEEKVVDDESAKEAWKYHSSVVISAFPHTSYSRSDEDPPKFFDAADVRRGVVEELETKGDANCPTSKLVSSMLFKALLGTLSMSEDWSLDFRELFREALGDVAEEHDELYRIFVSSIDGNGPRMDVEHRRKGVQLGLRIADIIDELNIVRTLFETQRDVLNKASEEISNVESLTDLSTDIANILHTIENDHLAQIAQMVVDCERIQRNLLDYMDLLHKEENLYEVQSVHQQVLFTAKQALSAQDTAYAAKAQSQIIFIFTGVTIIFLPLSFFTSYFGMNIDDGTGETTNYTRAHVNLVMGWASGPLLGVVVIGSILWFYIGRRESKRVRTRGLLTWDEQGLLPEGLITKTDREYERMEKMRKEDREREEKEQQEEKRLQEEQALGKEISGGGGSSRGSVFRRKFNKRNHAIRDALFPVV